MEIINYVGTGVSHTADKTKTSHTSTSAQSRTYTADTGRTIYRTSTGQHTSALMDPLRGRTATLSSYRTGGGTHDRTGTGLRDRTGSGLNGRTNSFSAYRPLASAKDRTGMGRDRTAALSTHRPLASMKDRTLSGVRTGATPMSELLKGQTRPSRASAVSNATTPLPSSKTVTPTRATMSVMPQVSAAADASKRTGTVLSREMIKEAAPKEATVDTKRQNASVTAGGIANGLLMTNSVQQPPRNDASSARSASPRSRAVALSPLAFAGRVAEKLHRALGSAAAFATAAVVGSILVMGADWYASHTGPLALQDGSTAELDALSFIMQCNGLDSVTDTVSHSDGVDELHELAQTAVPVIKSVVAWQTYTVTPGDTIIGLTHRFGLENISTIIATNGVDNARAIRAGQKLRIPSMDGLVYTVKAGNTLEGISSKYSVSMEDLLDVNDLASKDLSPGQELFIPGVAMDSTALREVMGDLMKCPLKTSYRVSSHFGWRADPFTGVRSYHSGVDMACPMGTPIYAAMGGKVITAGWSNVFGNYVIVDHRNGYQSLYGHMSKRIAVRGQIVNQGDRLGLVGSTGYSTGPHLHFTVYKKGHLTDPLALLRR